MHRAIIKAWPVFFGLGMIMIGNGLQGTLLGVRATLEDFSVLTTGLIMSSYYIGFFLGTLKIPHYVMAVGHIRVFAALASLAATTVLIHGVFVDPLIWAVVRAFSGFAFAGLFIVVESWLNDSATNETRGMMLGIYLVVTYIGMVLGQMLLNIASPADIELFITVSILISLALLPISLSKRPAPDFTVSETISFFTIWRRSPLGIAGVMASGFASAAIFSIGPIFALEIGLSTASISAFMSAFIVGGILSQLPVAWLSDRVDRRKVIIGLSLASMMAVVMAFLSLGLAFYYILAAMILLGAVCLTIYGQCLSHVNDHLLPRQFVASSATLLLLNGIGAAFGPLTVTGIMQAAGPTGFLVMLLIVFTALATFGLYRSMVRPPVPLEDQGDTFFMPARGSSMSVQIEDE